MEPADPAALASAVAGAMLPRDTAAAARRHTAFAYACAAPDVATVAPGASIAVLARGHAGDVLVAESRDIVLAGRSGVRHVEVRTAAGGRSPASEVSRAIPAAP